MVRVTRPGDPVTVGLTRLGQARVLEERPTQVHPTNPHIHITVELEVRRADCSDS